MATRHYTEATVPYADIAQRVLNDQQFGVNLSIGDLVTDPGLPRYSTAVQMKRPAPLSHEHCVTVIVAELLAEQVGEIRDHAQMADQLPERLGKTK